MPDTLTDLIGKLNAAGVMREGEPVQVTPDNVIEVVAGMLAQNEAQARALASLRRMRKPLLAALGMHADVFED